MESLTKTSSGPSCQVPISPRREDSHFPPRQTGPRGPAIGRELGSGKLSRGEGIPLMGIPGAGGFYPACALYAHHCAPFHLHICGTGRWVFLSHLPGEETKV